MGARGCAAGELDLGPGGGFRVCRGLAGRGCGLVLGGGALRAKSRATGGWGGGLRAVRPLRPTPRSSRRTLGPRAFSSLLPGPNRVQGPGCGGGAPMRGESRPFRIPTAAVGAPGVRGAPRADKGTKKAFLSKRAAGRGGGADCGPPSCRR